MTTGQCFREQGSWEGYYRINEFHQLPWKSATLPLCQSKFGYDRFLTASGAYKHHKIPMMRTGDWGQGKNCTLFMFNSVLGDADDPEYRNPKLTGNVRYEIDFRAAVGHNITVVIWSKYENIYEIDQWG